MVAVELFKIIIDEKNHDQAIVLKEKGGSRQLPIVIGFPEASSIQIKISGVVTSRPLTHDLFAAVITALGARLERLTIDDVQEGIFFAKLVLQAGSGKPISVDCRPSDGIAVAVRLNAPMFVDEKVFAQAIKNDK